MLNVIMVTYTYHGDVNNQILLVILAPKEGQENGKPWIGILKTKHILLQHQRSQDQSIWRKSEYLIDIESQK
jgi:hypothetical protein